MKRIYFIIIISVAILAIIVGLQFFDKSDENQNTQTSTISGTVDSSLDELKPQTNNEGTVTISVVPRKSASAGIWEFEITLDTHSVELDSDLTKAAILIADDKEYQPIAWDGDPLGGHHREGILQFAPISPQQQLITLKINNVGGIEERNFNWQFIGNLNDMQYAWLIWSLILLVIWLTVYLSLKSKESKREMLMVSFWTSLLGLTEPLFVPEYWSPPSLFDLALRTGLDIESLLFAFGVGGLAVVIYERIFQVKHAETSIEEKHHSRHKYHLFVLFSAPIIFVLLLIFTNLNPIYSTFIALVGGGLFTWYCRPDLKKKMFASAFIFTFLYFAYFLTLIIAYPGYVESVWNLAVISGILIVGIPLEELMFAFGLGFLWSSVYEHIKWRKVTS